jgi:hypothetical protein
MILRKSDGLNKMMTCSRQNQPWDGTGDARAAFTAGERELPRKASQVIFLHFRVRPFHSIDWLVSIPPGGGGTKKTRKRAGVSAAEVVKAALISRTEKEDPFPS